MAEAANALRGGWVVTPELMQAGNLAAWSNAATAIPEVADILEDISTKYDIPRSFINDAAGLAFLKDSGMMLGNRDMVLWADRITKQNYDHPAAMKKVISMIRKKVHAGGSRRWKMPTAQKMQRRAAANQMRLRNRATLQALPWYGSNPYNPSGPGTARYYSYTYPGLPEDYLRGQRMFTPRGAPLPPPPPPPPYPAPGVKAEM